MECMVSLFSAQGSVEDDPVDEKELILKCED